MIKSHSARELIRVLYQAGSRLSAELNEASDIPLGEYLKNLIPDDTSLNNPHFSKLLTALKHYLNDNDVSNGGDWLNAFLKNPVIQSADHSFLLLDYETLLNNLLFAFGAKQKGIKKIITIQCSAVSCITRFAPLRGSPFINRCNNLYNIFGLSKRKYKKSSFITLPSPVITTFDPISPDSLSLESDPYLAEFVGKLWPSAVTAFQRINSSLWQDIGLGSDCDLLIADDRLTSELIALHIEDETSPIHRIVFDVDARQFFIKRKKELINSPYNIGVNRAEPDHFWIHEEAKAFLRPLIFSSGKNFPFYVKSGKVIELGKDWFTSQNLASAIRRGILVPDIILIYLARCILCGVDAIGGASQQDYIELYRRLLLDCDDAIGLLSKKERDLASRRNPSRLGGAPLVDGCATLELFFRNNNDLGQFAGEVSNVLRHRVGETIGDLHSAAYLREHALASIRLRNEYIGY